MPEAAVPKTDVSTLPAARPRSIFRLSALGPGIVYTLTVLGSGDIVSNAAAGAGYGYALIWALGLTLVFRYVWVNTSAKYVLVTGESLIQGYGRLGTWVIWIVLISGAVIRHLYNLYKIVMMGSAADLLFHLPTQWSTAIWALLFVLVGFGMMFWGGYPVIEIVFKVLIAAMGGSLIVAALLAHPDPAGIIRGTFIPTVPGQSGIYSALFVLMALIGTEAGSMTNLTYPYFMYEKGWRHISYLKQQRWDLAVGVSCIFLMGALLQIAAAGTVRPLGISLKTADDLVKIFTKTQGLVGLIVFGLGLWGASFSSFVGATTGYSMIATDIFRSFIPRFKRPLDRENKEEAIKKDPIYRWAVVIFTFSPIYIVFTGVKPVWLTLMVSSLVVVAIPVLAVSLLIITNRKSLMGAYRNGWFTNLVMIVLVLISVYFTYRNGIDLWKEFIGIFHR